MKRSSIFSVAALVIAFSLVFFTLQGCSSSNCGTSFGGILAGRQDNNPIDPNNPNNPVDPNNPNNPGNNINRRVSITVTYPDGTPIPGVTFTTTNPSVSIGNAITDANGNYIFDIVAPEGTTFALDFVKQGHIVNSIDVVLDGDNTILPDGTILYPRETIGYIPFTPDVVGKTESLNQRFAEFCTYTNGVALSPDGNTVYLALGQGEFYRAIIGLNFTTGQMFHLAGRVSNHTETPVFSPGTGIAAVFENPCSIAITNDGLTLYVTDGKNVRKVMTASGEVTTLTTANVSATSDLRGIALSPDGTTLYVSDNAAVYTVDTATGASALFAGSVSGATGDTDATGAAARFLSPQGIAISSTGDFLYVADRTGMPSGGTIRKISIPGAVVTTISSGLSFNIIGATGLAISPDNSRLFVTEGWENRIVTVPTSGGLLTPYAGSGENGILDGVGTAAQLDNPQGIAITQNGQSLIVLGGARHRVSKINVATATVTSIMGGACGYHIDEIGFTPFRYVYDFAIAKNEKTLYLSDNFDHRILALDLATNLETVVAGSSVADYADGVGEAAMFNSPWGVVLSPDGNHLYVAEYKGYRVRKINLTTKMVTTVAGDGNAGYADGTLAAAQFGRLRGIAISADGNTLYVNDLGVSVSTPGALVRKIDILANTVSTIAGDSVNLGHVDANGTSARFGELNGIALSKDGNSLYVSDYYEATPTTAVASIRKIDISTPSNTVSTFVGSTTAVVPSNGNGIGNNARFTHPAGLSLSTDGTMLFVADGNRIRIVELSTATVATLAGTDELAYEDGKGDHAQFGAPWGVRVNSLTSLIYVADTHNHVMRTIMAVTP